MNNKCSFYSLWKVSAIQMRSSKTTVRYGTSIYSILSAAYMNVITNCSFKLLILKNVKSG